LGAYAVFSHTVRVNVTMKNRTALGSAVVVMKGQVLGEGTHSLFAGQQARGFGFTLPNWNYPLVLGTDNVLNFDDYHGRWGRREDIATLNGHYTLEAARLAAMDQGWLSERLETGNLLIHHPEGPTITVFPDGRVDANGFQGNGCDIAAKIEDALGNVVERSNKQEYYSEFAHIRQ
jgi:hypothetical protein